MSEQAINKHKELMAKREEITLDELKHAWNLFNCKVSVIGINVIGVNNSAAVIVRDLNNGRMYYIEIGLVRVLSNLKYEHFKALNLTRKYLTQQSNHKNKKEIKV